MILCDREIREALDQKRLVITPAPAKELYTSTAVDLRLSSRLRRWVPPSQERAAGIEPRFRPGLEGFNYKQIESKFTVLQTLKDTENGGYDLAKGSFVIGYTAETIYLPYRSRLCARVEGKSSLARLGLGVHVTAPTIHAGFGYNQDDPRRSGTELALEIWNVGPLPIELRAGMRICQLILEEVREVPTSGYEGQFNPQARPPRRPRSRNGTGNG